MQEAAKHVCYRYLLWDIVSTAQNFKTCRDKGKNVEVISGKKRFTTLEAVVEPNEEMQLDIAVQLPDKNKQEVYSMDQAQGFRVKKFLIF